RYRKYYDYVYHRENQGDWNTEGFGMLFRRYQKRIPTGGGGDRIYRRTDWRGCELPCFLYIELCITECLIWFRRSGKHGFCRRYGGIRSHLCHSAVACRLCPAFLCPDWSRGRILPGE